MNLSSAFFHFATRVHSGSRFGRRVRRKERQRFLYGVATAALFGAALGLVPDRWHLLFDLFLYHVSRPENR